MIYGIKDWRALYENAETRRRKNLGWVLTPNRHDSMAFGKLMARGTEGLTIFGAWMVLLQLSSRGPYCYRGILCDSDGHPYSIEAMAVKTRVLISDLELSIPVLVELKWLFATNRDLFTIYVNNPQPYGETEPPHVETEPPDVNPQGLYVDLEIPTQKPCAKYKRKNKNNNPPTKPKHSKTGGGYLIPEKLKAEPFMESWSRWVVHLKQRQGSVSSTQLAGHLDELKNDAPATACERLEKAIKLGYRMPCKGGNAGGAVKSLPNDVDALTAKIEKEIGNV